MNGNFTPSNVLNVHYGNKSFNHILTADSSTWNNNTYLNLIKSIRNNYGLTESFSLYENVSNEQFIIDDIDDIIATFENDNDFDDNNPNPTQNRISHIYVKDHQQIEREMWVKNSYVLIYSRSKQKWFSGKIIEISGKLQNEWLVVKYQKTTKEIQRNSQDIKPVPSNNILSLRKGSFCFIRSDITNIWYKGEVMSILIDNDGEWLAIKYIENDQVKISDIQRGSKQLKIFSKENIKKLYSKRKIPTNLSERIKYLGDIQDNARDKAVKILFGIFAKILKEPLNSKHYTLKVQQIAKKFSEYNTICVGILYDAGFIKSNNGKRIMFKISNMKLLKKADTALKKTFNALL